MALGKIGSLIFVFYASSLAADEQQASLSKMFLEADRNKDGFLSLDEYGVEEGFDPAKNDDEDIESHEEATKSFEKLDEDKDGRLSQAEMAKPMEVSATEETAMSELDKDRAGGLSLA